MIPESIKGRVFMVLTFLNFGIAAFFAGLDQLQQVAFSGLTAIICFGIWWSEIPTTEQDD